MRGARRAVRIAAVAVVVLLVGELIVRVRAHTLPPHQRWPTMQMQFQDEQIGDLGRRGGASVVFLGSSTIAAAIDPSRMRNIPRGRPGYNAGLGDATLTWTAAWWRSSVLPRLRPDTVVLGLSALELSGGEGWAVHDTRYGEWPGVRHILGAESVADVAERRLEDWSRLFEFRTLIREPSLFGSFVGLADLPEELPRDRVAAPDGQVLLFGDRKYRIKPFVERLSAQRTGRAVGGRREMAALGRLLRDLTASVSRVLVVSMPVSPDYLNALPHKRDDKVRSDRAVRIAADRAGARFVNAGIWPTTMFADPVHVNAAGSRRITTLVDRVLGDGRSAPPRV